MLPLPDWACGPVETLLNTHFLCNLLYKISSFDLDKTFDLFYHQYDHPYLRKTKGTTTIKIAER